MLAQLRKLTELYTETNTTFRRALEEALGKNRELLFMMSNGLQGHLSAAHGHVHELLGHSRDVHAHILDNSASRSLKSVHGRLSHLIRDLSHVKARLDFACDYGQGQDVNECY